MSNKAIPKQAHQGHSNKIQSTCVRLGDFVFGSALSEDIRFISKTQSRLFVGRLSHSSNNGFMNAEHPYDVNYLSTPLSWSNNEALQDVNVICFGPYDRFAGLAAPPQGLPHWRTPSSWKPLELLKMINPATPQGMHKLIFYIGARTPWRKPVKIKERYQLRMQAREGKRLKL